MLASILILQLLYHCICFLELFLQHLIIAASAYTMNEQNPLPQAVCSLYPYHTNSSKDAYTGDIEQVKHFRVIVEQIVRYAWDLAAQ